MDLKFCSEAAIVVSLKTLEVAAAVVASAVALVVAVVVAIVVVFLGFDAAGTFVDIIVVLFSFLSLHLNNNCSVCSNVTFVN